MPFFNKIQYANLMNNFSALGTLILFFVMYHNPQYGVNFFMRI